MFLILIFKYINFLLCYCVYYVNINIKQIMNITISFNTKLFSQLILYFISISFGLYNSFTMSFFV